MKSFHSFLEIGFGKDNDYKYKKMAISLFENPENLDLIFKKSWNNSILLGINEDLNTILGLFGMNLNCFLCIKYKMVPIQ